MGDHGKVAHLFVGGGDAPEMTIDQLVDIVTAASHAYALHLSELFDVLLARLEELGMKFDLDKGNVTLPL